MSGGVDLLQLLQAGELDPETIENLRAANLDEVRQALSQFLCPEEVTAILDRLRALQAKPR